MTNERGSSHIAAGNLRLHDGKVVDLTRRLSREFSLHIAIPPFDAIALEVLNLLEQKDLKVFPPDGDLEWDEDFLAGASLPVPLLEWLPLGCQAIRWDIGDEVSKSKKPGLLGVYKNNAPEILFRSGSVAPPAGPAALYGEIVICQEAFPYEGGSLIDDQLRCVIAHELVHVFEMLRLFIPAAQDWDLCWTNLLKDGSDCEVAKQMCNIHSCFLDNYGSINELAMLQDYWPSYAETWFNALRLMTANNSSTS